jgi:hypothetical protein
VGAQARGATGQQERRPAAALTCRERNGDAARFNAGATSPGSRRVNAAHSSAIFRRVASSNERAIELDYNSPEPDEMT